MPSVYQDENQKIWEEKDIIFIKYKCKVVNLEVAKTSVNERLKIMNGRKMPVILDLTDIFYCNISSMRYASSIEGRKDMTAGGTVVKNKVSEIIANSFLLMNPPVLPTKITYDLKKAINWVEKFKLNRLGAKELENIFTPGVRNKK